MRKTNGKSYLCLAPVSTAGGSTRDMGVLYGDQSKGEGPPATRHCRPGTVCLRYVVVHLEESSLRLQVWE